MIAFQVFFPLKFNPILHTYYVGYWKTEMGRGGTEGAEITKNGNFIDMPRNHREVEVHGPQKLLSKNWAMMCLLSFCFLLHQTSWPLYVGFSTSMIDTNKNPASVLMIHLTSVSQMCMQLLVSGGKWQVLNHHKHAIMNSIYFREVLTCNKRCFGF